MTETTLQNGVTGPTVLNPGFMACRAGSHDGLVRCGNRALGNGRCVGHQRHWDPAPKPTAVILYFYMEWQEGRELNALGVPFKDKPLAEREAAKKEQAKMAATLNRDIHVRGKRYVDGGTRVFAGNGILARVRNIPDELAVGFTLSDIHLEGGKDAECGKRLVLYFTSAPGVNAQEVKSEVHQKILALLGTIWEVHVWANPVGFDGACVHTVNLKDNADAANGARARYNLSFANGDWAVTR